ncbi:MAG TPA: hypothetical protein VMI72_14080 [Roseiarcus sp.]|nr:hypothetical protein [Roseiarcus sp.]
MVGAFHLNATRLSDARGDNSFPFWNIRASVNGSGNSNYRERQIFDMRASAGSAARDHHAAVIPAKAGIPRLGSGMPASAGMTTLGVAFFGAFRRNPLKRLKTGATFPHFFASFPLFFAHFPRFRRRQNAKIGGFLRL